MITILYATITVVAFYFGIITGHRLSREENIEVPIKTIKRAIPFTNEHKEAKKEDKEEQDFKEKVNNTIKYIEEYRQEGVKHGRTRQNSNMETV